MGIPELGNESKCLKAETKSSVVNGRPSMSKILGSNPSPTKRNKKPGLTVHTYNNPTTEDAEVGGLRYMARHYLKEMGREEEEEEEE